MLLVNGRFKFVLKSNAPSNLTRIPILKALFGWKRCTLYLHKYGISNLGSVVTRNINIQNEINGKFKKGSQFYHLVEILLKKQGHQ